MIGILVYVLWKSAIFWNGRLYKKTQGTSGIAMSSTLAWHIFYCKMKGQLGHTAILDRSDCGHRYEAEDQGY